MSESRFVSSAKLMPLIKYFAAAFVVVLVLGALLPPGGLRSGLVAVWLVGFPVGAWLVFKRAPDDDGGEGS